MNHPTTLALGPNPRVLFLSTDAQALRAQLAGRQLTLDQAGALRDDVSTDEITPVPIMSHYDDRLARFPYTGFKAGGETPDRRRRRAGRRLRGDGRGRALRQGLVARAQPGRRKARRHPAGHRARASSASTGRTPTTSACSPRPTSGWSSASSAARRSPFEELLAGRDDARGRHPAQRRPAALRAGASARRRVPAIPAAGARPPHAVREDRRTASAGHAGHRRGPATGRRRLRARRLALHPRVLHRHGAHMLHSDARPSAGTARAAIHRRVRGPHLVRGPEPRAPARRPRAEHAGHVPGAARLRRAATACACTAR